MIERYARKKLLNLWSDKTRFKHMLDVELATTFAFSQMGIVPKEDYEKMLKNAKFEVDRILEIEKKRITMLLLLQRRLLKIFKQKGNGYIMV